MTIASSVVDVRDIEEDKLFFYRVGCVPETYIWKKLRNTEEKTPIVLGKFTDPDQVRLAQNLMTLVAELMNCGSWRLFLPCSIGEEGSQSWQETQEKNCRVVSCFETGISFYDNNQSHSGGLLPSSREDSSSSLLSLLPDAGEGSMHLQESDEPSSPSSELVVPVIKKGRICAVIEFLNKLDPSGYLCSFTSRDVHTVKLACNQISEMIEISEVGQTRKWKRSTAIFRLDERGFTASTAAIQGAKVDLTVKDSAH